MRPPNVFKVGSRVRCVIGCVTHRGYWVEAGTEFTVTASNRRDLWLADVPGVVDPDNFAAVEDS